MKEDRLRHLYDRHPVHFRIREKKSGLFPPFFVSLIQGVALYTPSKYLTDMQTTRQQKIERLIQKDLSDIFLRYARTLGGTLISVSEVRISPDLSIAHIYVSIYPQPKVADTMQRIEEDTHKLRGELGNLERHQLRIIPELHFHLDETLDRMEHIDSLLKHE